MKRLAMAVLAILAATFGLLLVGTPAQAADTAQVSVVHGIPNTPVNVFVNGKSTLANFKPGTVAGPLALPPGTYDITIFPAANTKGTGTPLLKASQAVEGGKNYTLTANLTAAGKPTINAFVNNIATVAPGKARIVVRHTAAAPAVDVRANGTAVFKGLTNPKEVEADLDAGSIKADVTLAGTSTVAIGPATLDLKEGTSTIVYAIGSAADKTLGLVVQTIPGLHSAPGGVPSGSGGFAATGTSVPVGVWLLSAAGLLLAMTGGASALRAVRTRR